MASLKKKIFFFLVLLGVFIGLYHSPFSYYNDSYGLSGGPKHQIIVENLIDVWDFVYIRSINFLYLFLGEKVGIILAYHILVRMVNCLILFLSLEMAGPKRTNISMLLTTLYGIYPFAIHNLYRFDGALIGELFGILLLFLVMLIVNGALHKRAKRKQQLNEPLNHITEEIEMKREGIPNFLELSDEEIRRNAMIAAGLLSAEEAPHTQKSELQNDLHKTTKESPSQSRFIENPLPVPKRHVKKEMDYEYPVTEDKMYYDIEEPEKNYFDIV